MVKGMDIKEIDAVNRALAEKSCERWAGAITVKKHPLVLDVNPQEIEMPIEILTYFVCHGIWSLWQPGAIFPWINVTMAVCRPHERGMLAMYKDERTCVMECLYDPAGKALWLLFRGEAFKLMSVKYYSLFVFRKNGRENDECLYFFGDRSDMRRFATLDALKRSFAADRDGMELENSMQGFLVGVHANKRNILTPRFESLIDGTKTVALLNGLTRPRYVRPGTNKQLMLEPTGMSHDVDVAFPPMRALVLNYKVESMRVVKELEPALFKQIVAKRSCRVWGDDFELQPLPCVYPIEPKEVEMPAEMLANLVAHDSWYLWQPGSEPDYRMVDFVLCRPRSSGVAEMYKGSNECVMECVYDPNYKAIWVIFRGVAYKLMSVKFYSMFIFRKNGNNNDECLYLFGEKNDMERFASLDALKDALCKALENWKPEYSIHGFMKRLLANATVKGWAAEMAQSVDAHRAGMLLKTLVHGNEKENTNPELANGSEVEVVYPRFEELYPEAKVDELLMAKIKRRPRPTGDAAAETPAALAEGATGAEPKKKKDPYRVWNIIGIIVGIIAVIAVIAGIIWVCVTYADIVGPIFFVVCFLIAIFGFA